MARGILLPLPRVDFEGAGRRWCENLLRQLELWRELFQFVLDSGNVEANIGFIEVADGTRTLFTPEKDILVRDGVVQGIVFYRDTKMHFSDVSPPPPGMVHWTGTQVEYSAAYTPQTDEVHEFALAVVV